MRVKVKARAVIAESETVDDAELLLSLRKRRTSLAPPRRGLVASLECPVSGCTFIAKNQMGLSVHTARAHKESATH